MAISDLVQELRAKASAQAGGLDDLGPEGWQEGLALLLDSVETAPHVEPSGRADLHQQVVDALTNRLRIVHFHAEHPELAAARSSGR